MKVLLQQKLSAFCFDSSVFFNGESGEQHSVTKKIKQVSWSSTLNSLFIGSSCGGIGVRYIMMLTWSSKAAKCKECLSRFFTGLEERLLE